jgi:hypothetical protein
MKKPLFRLAVGVAIAASALVPVRLFSQSRDTSVRDPLVTLLLFGGTPRIDPAAYSPEVRAELQRYLQRYKAYRSTRRHPVIPGFDRPERRGEERMIYAAWTTYERNLAAVSADPKAPALAKAYLDRLKPCYEWEAFHDCPEREARFAVEYQEAHPGGPFSEYLPLLAAHRWLCAAEGYGYEGQPEGAARSRKEYERMIETARRSKDLLVRVAAEKLAQQNTCH